MAAVGAGTGLGMASLFWDGQRYHACPSEGGHIGFAPRATSSSIFSATCSRAMAG